MTKYAILTSVLILAACSGGSGGGIAPVTSSVRIGTVSNAAAESDAFVTHIAPEIGVAQDGSVIDTSKINQRSATKKFTYNGIEYTSYTLKDTKFWGADDVSGAWYLTFDVDNNGKITKVLEHDGGDVYELGRADDKSDVFISETQTVYKFQPVGYDSPVTDSLYEIPDDKDELIEAIQKLASLDKDTEDALISSIQSSDNWKNSDNWKQEQHQYKYELKGDLRYADFGYIEINGADKSVIAGGYQTSDGKITNIDKSNFNNKTMTFHGTAYGSAAYSYKDTYDNPRYKSKTIQTDVGAAQLVFKEGHETLTLPFNDYYTVKVETATNGGYDIDFKSYPDGSDVNFKLPVKTSVNTKDDTRTYVRADYYGADKNNPNEVVGTVYHEQYDSAGFNHEFQAAFGMKKDND